MAQYTYVADENENLDEKYGWVFEQLVIKKTELSLGVTITSHNKERTKQRKEYDLYYRIYTEEGIELEMQKGGGGSVDWKEDGTYQDTLICDMMDMPDTLVLKVDDGFGKVQYGTITVHLKK